MGIGAQAQRGLYTREALYYYCVGLPAVILGTVLALPVVRVISVARFRKAVPALIAAGAVACLARAAMGWDGASPAARTAGETQQ